MMYAVYYISALLQNAAFICLVRKACNFQFTKSKLLLILASLCSSVPQLVFLLPSKQIPPLVRIILVLVLMLIKAGCYAVIFRKRSLSMLYISVLSFVLNTNYTNLMHLFTDSQMPLNIAACIAEAAVTSFLLLYISRGNRAVAVTHSLAVIPKRLYVMILLFCSFWLSLSLRRSFRI